MPNLFFYISGENPSLPAAEVKAILEAENCPFSSFKVMEQLVRLQADLDCTKTVQNRAAFTRASAQEIFICDATKDAIKKTASQTDFKPYIPEGKTFVVRVTRIRNYADDELNTMDQEISLGRIIQQNTQAKVNLKQADLTFIGIITSDKFIFGLQKTEMEILTFSQRRPRKKPFFHPSAMSSKMARCMVNLAHGKKDALMLDPFCGTGSSLIEGALVGCKVVGTDALRKMVKGSKRNVAHFGVFEEGIILGDARQLPLNHIDCVVTDPPYGKSASTLKSTTKMLVQQVLTSAYQLLRSGQRVCIASPKTLGISKLGEALGFKHVESHFAYVHRTLTREICVFEKE